MVTPVCATGGTQVPVKCRRLPRRLHECDPPRDRRHHMGERDARHHLREESLPFARGPW